MMGRHVTGLLCIRMIDTFMNTYVREIDNIHVLLFDMLKKLPVALLPSSAYRRPSYWVLNGRSMRASGS